ncbi:MAG: nuclear transport factor 2 family protein [Phycisphaerales bacterium JB043]
MTTARSVVAAWVEAFNRADADAVASFYTENATNHQMPNEPIVGRESIREMFSSEFERADMHCTIESLFEDGEWAILEWSDPRGLRGCGFFHVVEGMITCQRGYWDRLSFLRAYGLPLPTE